MIICHGTVHIICVKKVQPTLQIKYFRKIVSIFGFNLHNYQVKLHVKLTQKWEEWWRERGRFIYISIHTVMLSNVSSVHSHSPILIFCELPRLWNYCKNSFVFCNMNHKKKKKKKHWGTVWECKVKLGNRLRHRVATRQGTQKRKQPVGNRDDEKHPRSLNSPKHTRVFKA